MKDYDLAEKYYLKALEKIPTNVEFITGDANDIHDIYIIMSV